MTTHAQASGRTMSASVTMKQYGMLSKALIKAE